MGRRGSSPLARGLQFGSGTDATGRRIIPARAGFTVDSAGCGAGVEDHPRSRGVYAPRSPLLTVWLGSSPLARGLHPLAVFKRGNIGIIPARAGFTASVSVSGSRPRDHPRSRGVYHFSCLIDDMGMGSSPLARGLQSQPPGRRAQDRIIPARAGFTRRMHVYSNRSAGSSPLARGLPPRMSACP